MFGRTRSTQTRATGFITRLSTGTWECSYRRPKWQRPHSFLADSLDDAITRLVRMRALLADEAITIYELPSNKMVYTEEGRKHD